MLLLIDVLYSYRGLDAAERRRKVIEESKYLGGDIEHTHLVKGLDYALLQKVSRLFDTSVLNCSMYGSCNLQLFELIR